MLAMRRKPLTLTMLSFHACGCTMHAQNWNRATVTAISLICTWLHGAGNAMLKREESVLAHSFTPSTARLCCCIAASSPASRKAWTSIGEAVPPSAPSQCNALRTSLANAARALRTSSANAIGHLCLQCSRPRRPGTQIQVEQQMATCALCVWDHEVAPWAAIRPRSPQWQTPSATMASHTTNNIEY